MNKSVMIIVGVLSGALLGYIGYAKYQENQKVKAARTAWEEEMYDPKNPWSKRRNANK